MELSSYECSDERTRATAVDALASKHAAAALGYFDDPFLQYFCPGPPVRRPPVINRGYFTRVAIFRSMIEKFLGLTQSHTGRQVICLGCGFDTASISYTTKIHGNNVSFFEIDHQQVIEKKAGIILSQSALVEQLLDPSENSRESSSAKDYGFCIGRLNLISADLRSTAAVLTSLDRSGVDWGLPTLVLTECVLVYLDKSFAEELCKSLQRRLSVAAWASYDMITPADSFGRMMLKNLQEAGYHIPGFVDFPSLDAQVARFTAESSWSTAASYTMADAFDLFIPSSEKVRIDKIERLDELEEWSMLMGHYCFTVATNNSEVFHNLFQRIPP